MQYNIYVYVYIYIQYIYPHDIHIWLVVWNLTFMIFHSVGNVIIPSDGFSFFLVLDPRLGIVMICLGMELHTTVSQSTVE